MLGFVKSLKVYWGNCYRSVKNAEKKIDKKKNTACERACVTTLTISGRKLHKYQSFGNKKKVA